MRKKLPKKTRTDDLEEVTTTFSDQKKVKKTGKLSAKTGKLVKKLKEKSLVKKKSKPEEIGKSELSEEKGKLAEKKSKLEEGKSELSEEKGKLAEKKKQT